MAERPLTPKQEAFVREYLVDLNATAAYRRAGYRATGRAAENNASRLLGNAGVKAAIAAAQAERAERTGITADRVLRELARVAFADPRKLLSWGPGGVRLLDSAALTDDEAAAVESAAESTSESGGSVRIKTHSKLAALQLLGRHLGMFPNKVELTGKGGGPVECQGAGLARAALGRPEDDIDRLLDRLASAGGDESPGPGPVRDPGAVPAGPAPAAAQPPPARARKA